MSPVQGSGLPRWILLWALVCALCSRVGSASSPLDYQIKAVYLVRFAQFVEWPEAALGEPDAPIVIGVLGSNPFGGHLDELANGERLNGRQLTVQRFSKVDEIGSCHVLFVSASEQRQLRRILQRLKGRPILTVGDTEDFMRAGGMIQFVAEDAKVRFRVARESVEQSGLTLSSKLLRAAELNGFEEH
jgi:hypothetical protein